MKYFLIFTFILFGCDDSEFKIQVYDDYTSIEKPFPKMNIDSMNSLNFEYSQKSDSVYNVFLPNYIGPYNKTFPDEKYFPLLGYSFDAYEKKPFSLFRYISPTRLVAHIDVTNYTAFDVCVTDSTNKEVPVKHYRAYYLFIKNKSFFDVYFYLKGQLTMLIEAKDKSNNWRPINFFSGLLWSCGTGASTIVLHPDFYLMTKIPVYDGDYKTLVRVKYEVEGKAYYSNEVEMAINYSQFDLPQFFSNLDFYTKSHFLLNEIN